MNSGGEWTLPQQFDEYRLVRVLGRGSMGVVFLGHDTVLDRPVAIKFINARDTNPRTRERFVTEARAAARIQHPNVMAIHRIGELEGRLYIISEYVRGQPLSELKGQIPWQEALTIAVGLARGLAAAHRQGVLHRDIKLANVIRSSETGDVKLLDFGLAKLDADSKDRVPRTPPPARPEGFDDTEDNGLPRVDIVAPLDSTLGQTNRADGAKAAKIVNEGESSEVIVGTPYYMAPELWRAEPASRSSDIYALGALLYILCAGHPPLEAGSTLELARLSQEATPRPLAEISTGIDPRFAQIVDRCLARSSTARFGSADELCTALEVLLTSGPIAEVVHGNPYRGLQAFEARHRAVFFGRVAEIRTVVDRLRVQPFVLVAGDSGVGKSSLCRAGALPAISEPPGVGNRVWSSVAMIPGRRPLQTLVSALASHLNLKEEALRTLLLGEPEGLVRLIARRQGKDRGFVLFIDQLEELVTLAEGPQVEPFGRFLASFAEGAPSLRLLASVRGDFLTRAAALPQIGPFINPAVYLLTPLTREGMREAITGPAALQGVHFESDGLVDELITAGAEGSLPLLQFALAELWEARQAGSKVITAADLERIGRVTGALARHADNVVGGLPPSQRLAVRRLLMRLVTIEDTRASLPLEELTSGDPANEAALEALVRGRLIVAREAQDGTVHEIAHEALIRNWGTLQVAEEAGAAQLSLAGGDELALAGAGESQASGFMSAGVTLRESSPKHWRLTLEINSDVKYTVEQGDQMVYAGRANNAAQDWLQFPATGVSWKDAEKYLRWLDATGRVPGARFCTEWEWERAARGADERIYPHADRLLGSEANIDSTYGKDATRWGPDVVGSHPQSTSVFGVKDLVGNVWEWTRSSFKREERVVRGGSFTFEVVTCSSINRFAPDPETRDGSVGLRVCASWPPRRDADH